ncbi:MAG: thiamine ABC transporter substrate-binding protein [Actinomycetota bacterium]
MIRRLAAAVVALCAFVPLAACSDSSGPLTLKLVTYDSFPKTGTDLNKALDSFTKLTGVKVEIITAGDTGTMVAKAKLTAGAPEGDVMFGVDNTLISSAMESVVFKGQPIAVDKGDVCVNYDIAWFTKHQLTPPSTLDDLLSPRYKNLLVVEDATASSPGLAFLLATIAAKGDAWPQYWKALRANGVEVATTWDAAYYQRFSGSAGSKGDKPLVVSYATSPPAEVVFANPPRTEAPTGVATSTCFHQVEYAGVLAGTAHPVEANKLVLFFTGADFQAALPLSLFVDPIDPNVGLPDVFKKFAAVPNNPYTIDPALITKNRKQWQDQWTQIVLR